MSNNNNKNSNNRIVAKEIQMGKHYILPIEQSRVTQQQAKVNKIIAETDAKAQSIINDANNKADVVVQTANVEAQRIIEEARKKAQQEYDAIRTQAYEEGFQRGKDDGFNKLREDAKATLNSLEVLASSTFQEKKNIIDSAVIDIVELVSAIADKVCHISFDDEILHDITLEAIKLLSEKESITLIVNPELVENITSMIDNFQDEVANLQQVKIVEDNSVSPDGVIVETLSARLDSRISAQIGEIAREMLMGT